MKNIVAVIVIVLVLGFAIRYIIKQKKNGTRCIGCPHGKVCKDKSSCDGSCKMGM